MKPLIMDRPETAERSASVNFTEGSSTRQRLRHPDARHIVTKISNLKPQPAEHSFLTQTLSEGSKNPAIQNLIFRKSSNGLIEVAVRCIFLRLSEIDTLNERYHAEILFEASWEEPILRGFPSQNFDPSKHWTPELELMNGIGDLQDDITYTVQYNRQGVATVTEHHKLKGTLWERMELQHFPVDVQDLSLIITTSRTNREMKFTTNFRRPSGVNRRVFMDEQEWHLFEHVDVQITEQIDEYLDDENNHSVVVCSCHVARKFGYFIWNAYFLIFLITSASFTTFPIPLANIFGRAQIGSTLLLTSITFRWLCNKSLPTISYLTAVDVYAIGSIFSLCLLNIYHGVVGYVNYHISTNQTNSTAMTTSQPEMIVIDRWALIIFAFLFFSFQIGILVWMYMVPWRKRRMLFQKDQENQRYLALIYRNTRSTLKSSFRNATRIFNQWSEISVPSNLDH